MNAVFNNCKIVVKIVFTAAIVLVISGCEKKGKNAEGATDGLGPVLNSYTYYPLGVNFNLPQDWEVVSFESGDYSIIHNKFDDDYFYYGGPGFYDQYHPIYFKNSAGDYLAISSNYIRSLGAVSGNNSFDSVAFDFYDAQNSTASDYATYIAKAQNDLDGGAQSVFLVAYAASDISQDAEGIVEDFLSSFSYSTSPTVSLSLGSGYSLSYHRTIDSKSYLFRQQFNSSNFYRAYFISDKDKDDVNPNDYVLTPNTSDTYTATDGSEWIINAQHNGDGSWNYLNFYRNYNGGTLFFRGIFDDISNLDHADSSQEIINFIKNNVIEGVNY